jgi:hypothetical protein
MMKFRIAESIDRRDVGKMLFIRSATLSIGKTISLKDGRVYKIIDVEYVHEERADGDRHYVQGVLRRIK